MCEPVTIAAVAISVVSTAYGVYATEKNADRQEKALRAAQAQEEEEIYDQKSVEAQERSKRARAERARLRAASAESGAVGLSIDEVLNDVDFQAGIDIANMTTNQTNTVNSSRQRLNTNLNRIEQPDYIAAGLQIGQTITGGYQQAGKAGG
jgi:hypothetical protein